MVSSSKATKRGRNGPCEFCNHFHKYEDGEACRICGHRLLVVSDHSSILATDSFAEILPEFLFLGDYSNASKLELLRTQGISRILNMVPSCKNVHRYEITYFSVKGDDKYPFDEALEILEKCERERARVLVHCLTGNDRSAAFVMAYLMVHKEFDLIESYRWVKARRPSIDIQNDAYALLKRRQNRANLPVPPPGNSYPQSPKFSKRSRGGSMLDSSPKALNVQLPMLNTGSTDESISDSSPKAGWDFLPSSDPLIDTGSSDESMSDSSTKAGWDFLPSSDPLFDD